MGSTIEIELAVSHHADGVSFAERRMGMSVVIKDVVFRTSRPLLNKVSHKTAMTVAMLATLVANSPHATAQTQAVSGGQPGTNTGFDNSGAAISQSAPTTNASSWRLMSPSTKIVDKLPVSSPQGSAFLSAQPGKKLVVVSVRLEYSGPGAPTVPVEEVLLNLGANSNDAANVSLGGAGLIDETGSCHIAQGIQGIISGGIKTSLDRTHESVELTRTTAQSALKLTLGGSPTHLCLAFAIPVEYQAPVSMRFADAATEPLSLDSATPTPVPQPVPQPVPGQPLTPVQGDISQPPIGPNSKSHAKRNFFESLFTARLELGAGGPFGGIVAEEEKMSATATYSDGSSDTQHPTHAGFHVSPNVELAAVRLPEFKLAFRLGYHYDSVEQDLTLGSGNQEQKSWTGTLLSTNSVLFGPVFYLNLGKGWFGSFEGLAGPIFGTLHPAAALKQVSNLSVPDVSYGGWMLLLGPGFGYAFGTLLVGGDLTYGMTSVSLDEAAYVNLGKTSTYNQIGFNAFVGAHL